MQLHLLITPDIMTTIPKEVKIIDEYGQLDVIFPSTESTNPLDADLLTGLHAIVEGEKEHIINWLKPFDGVPIGNGIPMMEQFTIKHIK